MITRKNMNINKKTRCKYKKLKGGAFNENYVNNENNGNSGEGEAEAEFFGTPHGSYVPQMTPQMPYFMPNQMPPQMPYFMPHQMPYFMPQQMTPQMPYFIPHQMRHQGPYFMPPQMTHQGPYFMPPQMTHQGPYFMPHQMPPQGPYFMPPQMSPQGPYFMPPQMASYQQSFSDETVQSSTNNNRPLSTGFNSTSTNNRPLSTSTNNRPLSTSTNNNRPLSTSTNNNRPVSTSTNHTRRSIPPSPPTFFRQETISNRFLDNIKTSEENIAYLEKIFMDRFKEIKRILNRLGYNYIKFRHIKPKPTGIYISWSGFTNKENYEKHKTLTKNNVGFDSDIITVSIHETQSAVGLSNYQSQRIGKMHIHFWKRAPKAEQKYVRLLLINTGEILFDKHKNLTTEETEILQIIIESLSQYIKTHMFVPVQVLPTSNMFPELKSGSKNTTVKVKPKKVKPVPVRPVKPESVSIMPLNMAPP